MNTDNLNNLLYEALETEIGGVAVYSTALKCAQNDDLKKEWQEGLDPAVETPGRKVVRHIGESLVKAMEMAKSSAPPEAAQIVAGECVVFAETKDHLNWELIGLAAKKATGDTKKALQGAYEEVEDEED